MQAHDVAAHEIFGEEAVRVTPPLVLPYLNGNGIDDGENGLDDDIEPENVTRVRLVQFQKNTDEPMVHVLYTNKYQYCDDSFCTIQRSFVMIRSDRHYSRPMRCHFITYYHGSGLNAPYKRYEKKCSKK